MRISNLLWLLPFACFIAGYATMRFALYRPEIQTPSLVGKHLYEAFAILSNHNLSPRLLDQKEDADLPEGTVLSQIPDPGKPVKERHTIFLVLSKKPPIIPAPNLINTSKENITHKYGNAPFKLSIYPVVSNYPIGDCIGQTPLPGEPITNNHLIAYISAQENKPIIWPDFTGKPLYEVLEFLSLYNIEPHINYRNPNRTHGQKIIDQRPLPGSIIALSDSQKPYVQLHVQ